MNKLPSNFFIQQSFCFLKALVEKHAIDIAYHHQINNGGILAFSNFTG
jgi:hypothetical protein